VNRRLVSTPAGWVAVAACATLAAAVSLAAALRLSPAVSVAPALCAAVLVLVARTRTAHLWRVAALITAAAAMGLLRGAVDGGPPVLVRAPHSGTTVLTGTVRDGTGSRRTASQVIVDAQRMETADGPVDVSGGVLATLRTPAQVLPGDQVELDATGLRPLRAAGAEAGLLRDGVSAVAQSATITVLAEGGPSPSRLLAQARLGLASTVDAALPEPGSSLVNALAFALPQPLPATLTAALRDSGLAHMLATSGLKVVLVAGVIGSLLAALATPPRLRLTLMAASVGGYILLCGASPAAVRSALMAATGWTLYGSGRSADPLPLLAAVAAAMLVVSPGLAQDVGFQLTFLGTLGILLFATPLGERLPGPRLLREPFAVTLAASAVTLPVMASTFGVISLVGPLANALAVPLLAPLLVTSGIGAALALVAPMLGFVPLQIAGMLAGAIADVAAWTAGLPLAVHVSSWPPVFTVAELGAIGAAATVWRAARHRAPDRRAFGALLRPPTGGAASTSRDVPRRGGRRHLSRPAALATSGAAATLLASLILLAAGRPDGRLHLAVLDVGAARADLVRTGSGDHALVDSGSDPQQLLDALGPALPPLTRSLGMVVLTSGDRLGAGGLAGLAGRYSVDRAVALDGLPAAARNALTALADRGTQVTTVTGDAAWTWGGATWRLMPAIGAATPAAALLVADPTGSALLVGNLDTTAQEELAGAVGDSLRADLLVAPPGGSIVPVLLDAARPRSIAVPSVRGARTASTTLLAGPGVRRTGDSGTLAYAGGDGGLTAT